jgi:plastocyanin
MRRLANWTAVLALVGGLSGVAPVASADQDDRRGSAQPTSFQAVVGAETRDEGVQALAFLPNDLTVNVGDTVTWSFPTHEPHTLSFLQPGQARPPAGTAPVTPDGSTFDGTKFFNSGILLNGATYTITFGAAGDFGFVCLIHGRQSGTIHVQAAGTLREQLQDDNDDSRPFLGTAADQARDLLDEGLSLERQELRAVRTDTDAVTIGSGFVFTTGSGDQSVMIARFLPATRRVHVGETIDWTATDPATPHTVTFGPAPGNPAAVVNSTNGSAVLPTTPPGLTVSSGFLGKPFAMQTFKVTFNAPGTYAYYCALHFALGMVGTIVVT